MSGSTVSLRRKIASAGELQSVVRTMKVVAASSVGQYEESVLALSDYYRTVQLGLGVCFRGTEPTIGDEQTEAIGAVVFGSDQGLVGQFNDVVADCARETLAACSGKPKVWVVGERVAERLVAAGMAQEKVFAVPNSVAAIAPLVAQILLELRSYEVSGRQASVYVFHNHPQSGALYEPARQRLLPLDAQWRQDITGRPWPTGNLPEVVGDGTTTVHALIHEYLFIALFRACAESLASENASRLAAMDRAEKNIDELLENLRGTFSRLRQSGIDEELFDLTAGFEALGGRLR